jgi:hypothetical protein
VFWKKVTTLLTTFPVALFASWALSGSSLTKDAIRSFSGRKRIVRENKSSSRVAVSICYYLMQAMKMNARLHLISFEY